MQDLGKIDLSKTPEIEQPKEEETEKKPEKTLGDYLAEFPNAPDNTQIERWKQEFGEVLCSGLSEVEFFVFRPITRGEFVNLQAYIASMKGGLTSFEVEQKIVETCVLWASPLALDALAKKAGTYSTLHEQILQVSNFINPAYVSNFVIKL